MMINNAIAIANIFYAAILLYYIRVKIAGHLHTKLVLKRGLKHAAGEKLIF